MVRVPDELEKNQKKEKSSEFIFQDDELIGSGPAVRVFLGMYLFTNPAVFFNIVQNAYDPPPHFLLNIW